MVVSTFLILSRGDEVWVWELVGRVSCEVGHVGSEGFTSCDFWEEVGKSLPWMSFPH